LKDWTNLPAPPPKSELKDQEIQLLQPVCNAHIGTMMDFEELSILEVELSKVR
jgi:hypothetical protein